MATDTPIRKKPKTVLYAEYALLTWTAWTCFFGIYQAWVQIPEAEKMMTDQLQGMISISPQTLMQSAIGIYALIAVCSVLVVMGINKGKSWARASLLAGFACDAIWTALPPYHGLLEFLTYIPDLGLQIYALYLLYTWPGERWFNPAAQAEH